jgi:hypothetical protein
MYFNQFKKIDFPFLINGKYIPTTVTDITNNVRLKEKLKSLVTSYEYYTILDGESPELISFKLYGTEGYHWILMLLNDRYDYLTDFPIPMPAFDDYCRSKYGLELDNIHHHEKTIDDKQIIISGLTAPLPKVFSLLHEPTGYPVRSTLAYDIFIKKMEVFNKQKELDLQYLNDNGQDSILPTSCDFPAITRPIDFPTESTADYDFFLKKKESLGHQKALNDSYDALYGITNYQYEMQVNDNKREIKYVPKEYIMQIANELKQAFL